MRSASDLAPATVVVFTLQSLLRLWRNIMPKGVIDPQHLVGLRCSLTEEIGRSEYENSIARPCGDLSAKGWWRAQETVLWKPSAPRRTDRGIAQDFFPSRSPAAGQAEPIASRDEASVDNELAALATNARQVRD
jgi:hypothetical protein